MPEVLAALIFVIFVVPMPLGSMLILICDLGTELLPAISYSFEPAEEDLMLVPPRKVLTTKQASKQLKSAELPSVSELKEENMVIEMPSAPVKKSAIKRWYEKYFQQTSTGEVLVDNEMLLWCYLQGGLIEAAACIAGYLLTFAWFSVPISNLSRSPYFKRSSPPLRLLNGKMMSAHEQVVVAGRAQAAYWLVLVTVQWFNMFLQKKRYAYPFSNRDIFYNKCSYVGMAVAVVIGAIVLYVPWVNSVIFQVYGAIPIVLTMTLAGGLLLWTYESLRRWLLHRGRHIIPMMHVGFFGGVPKRNEQDLLALMRTTSSANMVPQ